MVLACGIQVAQLCRSLCDDQADNALTRAAPFIVFRALQRGRPSTLRWQVRQCQGRLCPDGPLHGVRDAIKAGQLGLPKSAMCSSDVVELGGHVVAAIAVHVRYE
jgi:hypothetical protein